MWHEKLHNTNTLQTISSWPGNTRTRLKRKPGISPPHSPCSHTLRRDCRFVDATLPFPCLPTISVLLLLPFFLHPLRDATWGRQLDKKQERHRIWGYVISKTKVGQLEYASAGGNHLSLSLCVQSQKTGREGRIKSHWCPRTKQCNLLAARIWARSWIY